MFKIIQVKISVKYILNCPELRLKELSFPKNKAQKDRENTHISRIHLNLDKI